MKDGHLNKCKECSKNDVRKNYAIKSSDEAWLDRERKRGREKFKRLNYKGKFKSTRDLCPEMANVSRKLKKLGYDTSGKEAHHWNYNEPYSIFLLSRKAHKRLHQHLTVNDQDKRCYTDAGEPLKTSAQARSYFKEVLTLYGITEDIPLIQL